MELWKFSGIDAASVRPAKKKIVLITGASRGIGRAAAELFSERGYLTVLNARDEEALMETARAIAAKGGVCMAAAGDVSDFQFVKELFLELSRAAKELRLLQPVDILINNAGISHIGLLQDMSPEEWTRIVNINLGSVFNTCHEAIPHMLRTHSGRIINISSVWGVVGASCEAAYSATKGGINAFTRALGKELAPSGIPVNAIACGAVDTSMNGQLSIEEREALECEIPAGRMADPREAAELCLQLCEAGIYLTGQVIRFDGGWI
ncbi:MAG: SDR family NAD(P)-dependent oxidoreductase [Eubacteriales bacterium]|nr:SDR family NAD(P)-dependent oxidoreductase [Eubacteriales bacterium]